jgi:hypothetical protein
MLTQFHKPNIARAIAPQFGELGIGVTALPFGQRPPLDGRKQLQSAQLQLLSTLKCQALGARSVPRAQRPLLRPLRAALPVEVASRRWRR